MTTGPREPISRLEIQLGNGVVLEVVVRGNVFLVDAAGRHILGRLADLLAEFIK